MFRSYDPDSRRILSGIDSYLKWHREDIQEIEQHECFQKFKQSYDSIEANLQQVTNEHGHTFMFMLLSDKSGVQLVNKLAGEYVELYDNFRQVEKSILEAESKRTLTLDDLRKEYDLPIQATDDSKTMHAMMSKLRWKMVYEQNEEQIEQKNARY